MSKIVELTGGRALEHGIAMMVDHGSGGGSKMHVGGQANAQVAAGTSHENTIAEGALSVYTIPANTLVAGSTIRFWAAGVVEDNNSTDTLTTAIRLGTSTTDSSNTAVFSSAAVDVADDDIYCFQGLIQIRTAGSSGTAVAMVSYQDPDATGTAPKWNFKTSFAVDTTSALRLAITGDWSVAHADNEANSEMFVVDIVNPST
jgi:hypothetical protein|tara:strand:- start:530 stop:1135 length:606 start_codon:yes stop_codon:yes gene_type:complete